MNNTSEASLTTTKITKTEPYYSFTTDFVLPVFACYMIIVAVAIVGNVMVFYAVIIDRNLRNNPTTLLLLSLALSDLVSVTIVAPLDIDVFFVRGVWVHGELMCTLWSIACETTVPAVIWTLFVISVDRYKSLSDPLNRFRLSPFMTRKRALIINLFIWIYSVLFASIPSMGWRDAQGESVIYEGMCWFPHTRAYSLLTNFLNINLPLLITSGIHIKIYRIACERHKNSVAQGRPAYMDKFYLKNLQAAKTVCMFVGAFFFCWVPYSTYIIVLCLCDSCSDIIPEEATPLLLMLGYLNSVLNPFLFALRNKSFKAIYSKMFRSALLKSFPKVRKDSSLMELTFTSEIPDLTDEDICLQWISIQPQEERYGETVLRDVNM